MPKARTQPMTGPADCGGRERRALPLSPPALGGKPISRPPGGVLSAGFGSEADSLEFARSRIAAGATIVAAETPHWDLLGDAFDLERVTLSDAYSFLGGVHVNGAESYFARLRRMIRGQHHRVSPNRLGGYAAHAAWLEDHRRPSNGALVPQPIGDAFAPPISRLWKGYWRRVA